MLIRKLDFPLWENCVSCSRETWLRYKIKKNHLNFYLCTLCYEHQMELNNEN